MNLKLKCVACMGEGCGACIDKGYIVIEAEMTDEPVTEIKYFTYNSCGDYRQARWKDGFGNIIRVGEWEEVKASLPSNVNE